MSLLVAALCVAAGPAAAGDTPDLSQIPVPGRVTLVDLGADKCIPCKLMAPILEEVRAEYQGKAEVIFLDVRKDPRPVDKFAIQVIPTQIFFTADGAEAYRHEGVLRKEQIKEILAKLGVTP